MDGTLGLRVVKDKQTIGCVFNAFISTMTVKGFNYLSS